MVHVKKKFWGKKKKKKKRVETGFNIAGGKEDGREGMNGDARETGELSLHMERSDQLRKTTCPMSMKDELFGGGVGSAVEEENKMRSPVRLLQQSKDEKETE